MLIWQASDDARQASGSKLLSSSSCDSDSGGFTDDGSLVSDNLSEAEPDPSIHTPVRPGSSSTPTASAGRGHIKSNGQPSKRMRMDFVSVIFSSCFTWVTSGFNMAVEYLRLVKMFTIWDLHHCFYRFTLLKSGTRSPIVCVFWVSVRKFLTQSDSVICCLLFLVPDNARCQACSMTFLCLSANFIQSQTYVMHNL